MVKFIFTCVLLVVSLDAYPKSLGDKQREFSLCVAKLITFAYDKGYEVTLGDAYRDPRVKYGHKNSAHRYRLAIDLNLFKDKKYLTKTKDYMFLGKEWIKCNPLARWGGAFNDGNHFSFLHNGVR